MNLMAMGVIFSAWASWIFKAKLENEEKEVHSRNQAGYVNKYHKSIIENVIICICKIGINYKRQENNPEYIHIN